MNLDSVEAAKNMVRLGLGVSFLPLSAVRREVEFGSLTLIDLAEVPPVLLPTYLLLRCGQEIGPTDRSFLKLLQETYVVEIPVLLENR